MLPPLNRLRQILKDLKVPVRENSKSFILRCPKEGCGKEDKFYIRKSDFKWVCWSCKVPHKTYGGKRNLPKVLALYPNAPPVFALEQMLESEYFYTSALVDFKDIGETEGGDDNLFNQPDDLSLVEAEYPVEVVGPESPAFEPARKYLNSRGIFENLILGYQLKYLTRQRRVAFPMIVGGKLLGWQARMIDPEKRFVNGQLVKYPKMIGSIGLPRHRWPMFFDRLLFVRHCVLAEGPIDAIKYHLCGGNIATLGKMVTDEQLESILLAKPEKVYVGLDPDAIVESEDLFRRLAQRQVQCFYIELPPHRKDAGECGYQEVLEYFHQAKPATLGRIYV